MLLRSIKSRFFATLGHSQATLAQTTVRQQQRLSSRVFLIRRSFNSSSIMNASRVTKIHDNILKSHEDKRVYRGIEFDNGFKCLLISDPTTDKSAASVDVNVGYLVDSVPGLAHFCEHMLFLGSKKYPKENTFAKFIEENAGSSNAYTSSENTNYHFEISNPHLKGALDIFSQFFISPLFDADSVDREINAVNSENHKNLQIDGWRLDQFDKSLCRPDHPYSKFGTGNLETLKTEPETRGLNIRDELIKFHTKYYSSNLMSGVILGTETVDQLQKYIEEMFSDVPTRDIQPLKFEQNPYKAESLGKMHYIVPIQDVHNLMISFQLADYRNSYASNPGHYLSHLVGHEGPGSLLSELKARGWCNALYSGPKSGANGFSFFTISLDLSEEGVEHANDILELCFQYLNLIRTRGVHKWVQDELGEIGKINFTYKDKEKPISYVTHLASDMHTFEMKDVLSGNYLVSKYEPHLIEEILAKLQPDQMRVALVSKKFEGKTNLKEKWYGTEYSIEPISEEIMNKLKSCGQNSAFRIPERNEFIPNNLSLVKNEQEVDKFPRVVKKSPTSRLWFKGDNKFLLPKASARFELRNPLLTFDPKHNNMSNLFIDLLCDSLNEYTYAAELAGLRYNISLNNYAIQVDLNGFDNKFEILLEKIVERMASFRVDEKRYDVLKDNLKRSLLNFQANQPYSHSIYYMSHLLQERGWTKEQMLHALDDFHATDLQNFISRIISEGIFIDSIIYGNMTKDRAIKISDRFEELLINSQLVKLDKLKPLLPYQLNNMRSVKLPDRSDFVYMSNNKIHTTIGIEAFYQTEPDSTRNNILVELFCQIINEATYHQLRTQEQLGYIVASGVRRFGGMQGVRFILQSDRQPQYLDERIEAFIQSLKDTLASMSDEEFNKHKDALAVNKLEEPKRISKQCDVYWSEITSHLYHFNREQSEVDELKHVTKSDVIEFYEKLISSDAPHRRKIAVYVNPATQNDEVKALVKDKLIHNIHEFKAEMSLYALPKPFMNV